MTYRSCPLFRPERGSGGRLGSYGAFLEHESWMVVIMADYLLQIMSQKLPTFYSKQVVVDGHGLIQPWQGPEHRAMVRLCVGS